jgi:hypothetical protein
MRCPKCHTGIEADAVSCPTCKLQTPTGRRTGDLQKKKSGSLSQKKSGSLSRASEQKRQRESARHSKSLRILTYAAVIVLSLGVVGAGAYVYLGTLSDPLDSKAAMELLATLRQAPSTQEGFSVDERMNLELQKSRSSGKLAQYRGWFTMPYDGSKKKILIGFSFQEKDTGEQSFEWVADTRTRQFTPLSKVAGEVYTGK